MKFRYSYRIGLLLSVVMLGANLSANAQQVPKVSFEELQAIYHKDTSDTWYYQTLRDVQSIFKKENDTLYVINFWATWCKPCVEEMPFFEKISKEYREKPLKIIFVSLDFSKNYEDRVIPFVKKKDLQSEVVFLDQPSGEEWISEVHESWSGAIPATLFIRGDGETVEFREQSFEYEELKGIIEKYLQKG